MAQFRPDPERAQTMTPEQAMAMEAEQAESQGGWMSVVTTLMWTAGSLAVIVGVMLWAYGLGARDPAEVPALAAGPDWRRAPAEHERGGLTVPGQEAQVYARYGEAVQAPPGDPELSIAQTRPTNEDVAAARARAAALAEAQPGNLAAAVDDAPLNAGEAPSDAVVDMVRRSAARPEASERAAVIDADLETPAAEATGDALGGPLAARPGLPPNVGPGSAPPPEEAARELAEPIAERLAAAAVQLDQTPDPAPPLAASPGADAAVPSAASSAAAAAAEIEPDAAAPETAAAAPVSQTSPDAPPAPAPRPERAVDRVAIAARDAGGQVFQVQLAALPTEESVRRRWRELVAQAPQLLGAYALEVQPITRGGSRLFRLRIGAFAERAEAARLCRQLRLQEIDCFAARR